MSTSDPRWSDGVERWWETMTAGRRFLDELGQQLRKEGVSSGGPADAVSQADLGRLVEALQLMESRARADREASEARLARLEAELATLRGQVVELAGALKVALERVGRTTKGA